MFANKKEIYVETASGDSLLVEVEENLGWIMFTMGTHRVDISPDAAFDIVEALTMVAIGVISYEKEYS